MKHFITPTELVKEQAKYIILDIRGQKAYGAAHIPNAYVLDVTSDLSGPVKNMVVAIHCPILTYSLIN